MGRNLLLSDVEVAEMVEAYKEGLTAAELAVWYEVSVATIYANLKRSGTPRHYSHPPKCADTGDMVRLRTEGWTYMQIGRKFGLTKQAVHQRLSRRGK